MNNMKKDKEATFHGGFVRNRGEGRGVRVARAKASELPVADATAAQERVSMRADPETSREVMRPLHGRQVKMACLGIPSYTLDQGDEEYAKCVRQANSYKKARVKELFLAHGYVSAGVHALLASAALAIASSRFIYAAAARGEDGSNGVSRLNKADLKLASSLSDSARQNELSAWELCAREAVIKKRNDSNTVTMPWLVAADAGLVKRGRGRPRKVDLVKEIQVNAGAREADREVYATETEGSGQECREEPCGQ